MVSDLMGMHRIALVGREKDIQRIKQLAQSADRQRRAALIYIEGRGGLGKTALLEEIKKSASTRTDVIMSGIVDLYHLENQTPFGFCETITGELNVPETYFEKFRRHLEKFQEAQKNELTGSTVEELWKSTEREFVSALQHLSKRQQVWLLLDTAEMLNTNHSEKGERSGFTSEHISDWLLRIMPQLAGFPVFFLVAGRAPEDKSKSFYNRVRNLAGWNIERPIELHPLDAEACRDYLLAVAAYLDKHKVDGGNSIRNYIKGFGFESLHQWTGGKPLYLAMVSDILKTGGMLPEGFYTSENDRNISDIERETLTEHFMSLRAPIGITLRAMALLHKGVDADFLSRIMVVSKEKAENYLRQVEQLTLVKKRQGDAPRPYFLHDEIYDLYARQDQPIQERERIFNHIKGYYETFKKKTDRDMQEYPHYLSRYKIRRQMAKIEWMHYALWFHPWEGFAEYFSQSCSNLSIRNGDWEVLLEREFARTIEGLEKLGRFPMELAEYINWDGRIRNVERESIKKNSDAASMLDRIQEDNSIPAFCHSYLWYIRGMMRVRGQKKLTGLLSNPSIALDEARKYLDIPLPNEGLDKAKKALGAFIDNYRGYIARRAGQYTKAVEEYQKAAALMRQYDLEGLSGVLTNQAYAMSMLGLDRRAQETAREAFEVANKSNSIRDQARALNVRANAETLAGNFKVGEDYAKVALKILQSSPDERVQALIYVSLGRSSRYEWNQSLGDTTGSAKSARYDLIAQGLAYFEGETRVRNDLKWEVNLGSLMPEGAIELLANSTDFENLSAARNECGCLWREAAWVLRKLSDDGKDERINHAISIAEARLVEAAGMQKVKKSEKNKRLECFKDLVDQIGGSPFWPTLALTNLAWHVFYQKGTSEEVEEACKFVEAAVEYVGRGDHLWKITPPKVKDEDADMMLYGALGKMEMLRGYDALRTWRDDHERIEMAVEHIARAMEYNYLVGKTNFNMKRAELGLENRIRQSEDWQKELLPLIYQYALRVAPRLGLPSEKTPRIVRWLEERYGNNKYWLGGSI